MKLNYSALCKFIKGPHIFVLQDILHANPRFKAFYISAPRILDSNHKSGSMFRLGKKFKQLNKLKLSIKIKKEGGCNSSLYHLLVSSKSSM